MKSNIHLNALVQALKKQSNEQKVHIWKRLATDLEKPTRRSREVNLSRINLHAKPDETIVVAGKVLGGGELDHKVTVAAFKFSQSALDKIKESKGEAYSIWELIKKNPKGAKVRIIG